MRGVRGSGSCQVMMSEQWLMEQNAHRARVERLQSGIAQSGGRSSRVRGDGKVEQNVNIEDLAGSFCTSLLVL